MKLRDLIYETFNAIFANRVRSLLTVLGIVIGIGAVVAITALIDGMKMQLVGRLGLNLSRTVNITCYPPGNQQLDMDDLEEISRDLASDYDFITGYSNSWADKVSSTTASMDDGMSVFACEPEYFTAMGYEAVRGRVLNEEDCEDAAMSIVINTYVARELFGSDNAECVGQSIRIGNDQYTVVGVISMGSAYGEYAAAFMPYETAQVRIFGQNGYNHMEILGFAREGSDMYAVASTTEAYLHDHYNIPWPEDENSGGNSIDGFVYISTAQEMIDQLDSTMATFRLLALAVASVSLLVGGIGIMNMMLTNVTERIREIGLRKALGARRGDITSQFLLESVAICLVGGIFGIGAGYGGAWALSGLAGSAMGYEDLVPVIMPEAVIMATAICIGIGVLFGWYPARRAAKLDPVESLRYQ